MPKRYALPKGPGVQPLKMFQAEAIHHPSGPILQRAKPLQKGHALHQSDVPVRSMSPGAAGPFAVAGYRMGVYAQAHWKLRYGGWRLLVHHYTPAKVQWSCVADGLQAATGVSAGKLNLRMHIVAQPKMRTVIVHRSSKQRLTFRLTTTFVKRYLNTPRKGLRRAALEVAKLPAKAIFKVSK